MVMFVLPREGWRAVWSQGVGILVNYLHRERIPLVVFRQTSICFSSSLERSQLYYRAWAQSTLRCTHSSNRWRSDGPLSLSTGSNRIARRQSGSFSGGRVLKARPHDLEGRRLSALFQYPLLPFGSVFCRSRAGYIFRNRVSRVKHAVIISWLCLAPPRHGVGPRRPSLASRCWLKHWFGVLQPGLVRMVLMSCRMKSSVLFFSSGGFSRFRFQTFVNTYNLNPK